MFPASFEYVCPTSVAEAVGLLRRHGDNARILAGGQSLIPLLKLRLASPQLVVDIGRLEELRGIQQGNGFVTIGSLVRHAEIQRSELLARACPLLPETAAEIGDVQVRHRGTLGGSLAHADPAGDLAAAALALEAQLTAMSAAGQRTLAAQEFFKDLMTTALRPDEILTAIQVPVFGARTGSAYVKMPQQASGFAIVGVAAVIRLDEAGKVAEARVGLTGVAPVPYRAGEVEEKLRGRAPGAREIAEASQIVAAGVDALSDIHASAEYRRAMAIVFTRRSLQKALARAARTS